MGPSPQLPWKWKDLLLHFILCVVKITPHYTSSPSLFSSHWLSGSTLKSHTVLSVAGEGTSPECCKRSLEFLYMWSLWWPIPAITLVSMGSTTFLPCGFIPRPNQIWYFCYGSVFSYRNSMKVYNLVRCNINYEYFLLQANLSIPFSHLGGTVDSDQLPATCDAWTFRRQLGYICQLCIFFFRFFSMINENQILNWTCHTIRRN